MDIPFHTYPSRAALAEALATGVAAILAGGIATRGSASLAVSGGSTPKLFFEVLSGADIDWSSVSVLLVDERWVEESDERSNARLVRRHLLTGGAAAARFLPFFEPGRSPEEAKPDLDARFGGMRRPFDAVILGMGEDGHTASFMPGADHLAQATDPTGHEAVATIRTPTAGEPRVTLTLPMLVDARFLALHIEGEKKRRVFEAAQGPGPAHELPVRAVLRAPRERPVEVFWAA